MPWTRRTMPRSPDLARNVSSSQKPYRLMCACSAPDSFQSFTISLNLNISPDPYFRGFPFHRVIAGLEFGRIQQHPQNLRVVLRRLLRRDQTDDEEQNSTHEAVQQVEHSCAREQSDEKQPSRGSQDRQWPIHYLVD